MISLKGIYINRILVHLANYYDALIDYPSTEDNLNALLQLLMDEKITDTVTVEALKTHANKLKGKLAEDYNS